MQDKVLRGRQHVTRGVANGMCKLTAEQVSEIIALYASRKFTQAELGRRFGVSKTHIGDIVRRRVRPDVDAAPVRFRLGRAVLTAEQVLTIRRVYGNREATQTQLAERFGILQATVSAIVARKTWKHI